MTSQLLYIPARRTVSAPLGYNIEQYIQNEFHFSEGQASVDADALDKLRNKILDTPPHVTSLDILFE